MQRGAVRRQERAEDAGDVTISVASPGRATPRVADAVANIVRRGSVVAPKLRRARRQEIAPPWGTRSRSRPTRRSRRPVDAAVHRPGHRDRRRPAARPLEGRQRRRLVADAPAAVAAGRTEAGHLPLEHGDTQVRGRPEQVVGGPETGEPGADDRDVDLEDQHRAWHAAARHHPGSSVSCHRESTSRRLLSPALRRIRPPRDRRLRRQNVRPRSRDV